MTTGSVDSVWPPHCVLDVEEAPVHNNHDVGYGHSDGWRLRQVPGQRMPGCSRCQRMPSFVGGQMLRAVSVLVLA